MISPWRVRFPSVASPPPRHRPSRNVAKCRHQTNARPSAARQKSVAGPWRVRRVSRSDHSHGRLWTRRRPQSAASPCEPPRTNATRTNTRRTPHRKRSNAERTTDEHTRARSTGVPRKHDDRRASVCRPSLARFLSVARPPRVRSKRAQRTNGDRTMRERLTNAAAPSSPAHQRRRFAVRLPSRRSWSVHGRCIVHFT